MARMRKDQGAFTEALEWIDKAMVKLDVEHFRSEFLELRYDIRVGLSDDGAIADLDNAFANSLKRAERDRLGAKLAETRESLDSSEDRAN